MICSLSRTIPWVTSRSSFDSSHLIALTGAESFLIFSMPRSTITPLVSKKSWLIIFVTRKQERPPIPTRMAARSNVSIQLSHASAASLKATGVSRIIFAGTKGHGRHHICLRRVMPHRLLLSQTLEKLLCPYAIAPRLQTLCYIFDHAAIATCIYHRIFWQKLETHKKFFDSLIHSLRFTLPCGVTGILRAAYGRNVRNTFCISKLRIVTELVTIACALEYIKLVAGTATKHSNHADKWRNTSNSTNHDLIVQCGLKEKYALAAIKQHLNRIPYLKLPEFRCKRSVRY